MPCTVAKGSFGTAGGECATACSTMVVQILVVYFEHFTLCLLPRSLHSLQGFFGFQQSLMLWPLVPQLKHLMPFLASLLPPLPPFFVFFRSYVKALMSSSSSIPRPQLVSAWLMFLLGLASFLVWLYMWNTSVMLGPGRDKCRLKGFSGCLGGSSEDILEWSEDLGNCVGVRVEGKATWEAMLCLRVQWWDSAA